MWVLLLRQPRFALGRNPQLWSRMRTIVNFFSLHLKSFFLLLLLSTIVTVLEWRRELWTDNIIFMNPPWLTVILIGTGRYLKILAYEVYHELFIDLPLFEFFISSSQCKATQSFIHLSDTSYSLFWVLDIFLSSPFEHDLRDSKASFFCMSFTYWS